MSCLHEWFTWTEEGLYESWNMKVGRSFLVVCRELPVTGYGMLVWPLLTLQRCDTERLAQQQNVNQRGSGPVFIRQSELIDPL